MFENYEWTKYLILLNTIIKLQLVRGNISFDSSCNHNIYILTVTRLFKAHFSPFMSTFPFVTNPLLIQQCKELNRMTQVSRLCLFFYLFCFCISICIFSPWFFITSLGISAFRFRSFQSLHNLMCSEKFLRKKI